MPPLANDDDVVVDPSIRTFSLATQAIHADDHLSHGTDVAPALHVSTTFRYTSKPEDLVPAKDQEVRTAHPSAPPTHHSTTPTPPQAQPPHRTH